MTIPVQQRANDAPTVSAGAILGRLRDPALTLAAFALVLTAVFGFGPFRGPGPRVADFVAVHGDQGAMSRGPYLAGLSP